ncbi:MAG: ATP-binding cassette domain-containing protein [Bacteroidales bacterium]
MSEEILRALMQLFAIIAKQDEGVESNEIEYIKNFLIQQLTEDKVKEYYAFFEQHAELESSSSNGTEDNQKKQKLTSVKDSVRILGLCKKINKTLTQNQKVIVLLRLFELVNTDRKFTEQRMAIINTVAEVFKIGKEEFRSIYDFVINTEPDQFDDSSILIINDGEDPGKSWKHIQTESLDTNIIILRILSVDLYFLKYTGEENIFLNGMALNNKRIYLFANGSTVKLPKGKPVYYSDVVAHFLADKSFQKISFEVNNLEYRFHNGNVGLRNISFAEGHGKLIGIMGASGAGKTTLLNVLCGIEKPYGGEVLINGLNLHTETEKLEGVIGLIPQDDLLIEELTVFQNLYFSAKQSFREKTDEELVGLVDKTLSNLGLLDKKNLKVGSPMNKTISGGQRKRLNIALELIREPSILFVDEPTSGLSSRDSENVMDLLRELALKGKLIFVVIHQPSSDIYKMFDKMIILDTGGYLIYYGNPVEAVMYFKRIDHQINSEIGECPSCGNVNPELVFNIIEARVVDEFGNYTDTRKIAPTRWEETYQREISWHKPEKITEAPPKTLRIPGWLRQFVIYTQRDFLSKVSNTQYIALNMLEAPVLAFILAYIIRYIADPNSNIYVFRENENIPIYIFMSLIVALFLGLTVSAEEIFRDRKILKREQFLNLSRSSYLFSKILLLFTISAIQSFTFVIIANSLLDIRGMFFVYWFALFTTSAFANMLGLNISASFNSAVTIYIIIPLVMIPMMILSGAMFPFDKLNRSVGSVDKVPFIAEIMPTKWSYEALMVHQFKDNGYEKAFYDLEKSENYADYMQVYYIPELRQRLDELDLDLAEKKNITRHKDNIPLLLNELKIQQVKAPEVVFPGEMNFSTDNFTFKHSSDYRKYLELLEGYYIDRFTEANTRKQNKINAYLKQDKNFYNQMRDWYFNESVSDQVRKAFEKNKILEYNFHLVQQYDPIYQDPRVSGFLSIRSHFFAPRKHFAGHFYDTYWFNMTVIWIYTILLYVTLYFDLLRKFLEMIGKVKFGKKPGNS